MYISCKKTDISEVIMYLFLRAVAVPQKRQRRSDMKIDLLNIKYWSLRGKMHRIFHCWMCIRQILMHYQYLRGSQEHKLHRLSGEMTITQLNDGLR